MGFRAPGIRDRVRGEELHGLIERSRGAVKRALTQGVGPELVVPRRARGWFGKAHMPPAPDPGSRDPHEQQRRGNDSAPSPCPREERTRLNHGAVLGPVARGVRHQHAKRPNQFLGRLEPVRRLLREQAPAQLVVTLVELAADGRRSRRMRVRDLVEQLERLPSLERAAARQALVEDAPEGKQIAAAVDRPLLDLLGRHIGRGAEQRMRLGQARGRIVGRDAIERRENFRDPEIEQPGLSTCRQDDVLRFEIAMDDPPPVRGRQRVGDLRTHHQRVPRRHSAAREPRRQRLPLHVLHDHVRSAGGIDAGVVDGTDVWMVERGDRARFLYETARQRLVGGGRRFDELDRHVAPQRGVAREVDVPHAARTNQTAEAVPP